MDENDDFDIVGSLDALQSEINVPKVEISSLKPAWKDVDAPQLESKYSSRNAKRPYTCLDVFKAADKEQKVKKMKSFSVLSKRKMLSKGKLEFYRCTDGNRDYNSRQHISMVICLRKRKCMVTASQDSLVGLFQLDGEENKAICKPFFYERFPIKGGVLLADDVRVVMYSKFNSFRVLNLTTSVITRHSVGTKQMVLRHMVVCGGLDEVCVATKSGDVFVLSTVSWDVIDRMHVNGRVRGMACSHNGQYLYVLCGVEGSVEVYEGGDGKRVFKRRWADHGAAGEGKAIAVSADDNYVAVASSSGTVNIYSLSDTWASLSPTPIKTISFPELGEPNLLAFNPSSELLAIGSSHTDASLRLVHLASMTLFSNFPGPAGGHQRPSSLAFSPGSRFLAVGQCNGKVALYRLQYYV